MDKSQLRYTIATSRAQLDDTEVQKHSQAICRQIISLKLNAKNILCYVAKGQEVNINHAIQFFLQPQNQQKNVLLPSIEGDQLVARQIWSFEDLETGPYHILQPKSTCALFSAEQIDLAFIPGIAFDKKGHRLGRGAGYYDRFLHFFHGKKIGIGYELQLLEKIPIESHDVPIDSLITEKTIYHFT